MRAPRPLSSVLNVRAALLLSLGDQRQFLVTVEDGWTGTTSHVMVPARSMREARAKITDERFQVKL